MWVGCTDLYIGRTDYLYPYIQRLSVELNYNTLAVFIAERLFIMILYWVPNIPPLLLWFLWLKNIFKIRSYMVSTCIHLYLSFLIWSTWHRDLIHMIIDLFHPNNPPTLSLFGMYQKPFIYNRKRTNYK